MSDSIKRISQIKLNNHTFFFSLTAQVDGFLNQHYVVQNMTPFDEATLIFQNNVRHNFLNPVGYDFSNQFVTNIA